MNNIKLFMTSAVFSTLVINTAHSMYDLKDDKEGMKRSPSTEHFVPVIDPETGHELVRSPDTRKIRRSTNYVNMDKKSSPYNFQPIPFKVISSKKWRSYDDIDNLNQVGTAAQVSSYSENKEPASVSPAVIPVPSAPFNPEVEKVEDKKKDNIVVIYEIVPTQETVREIIQVVYVTKYLSKKEKKWIKKKWKKERKNRHKKRWKRFRIF